jgi:hypothetical protein
MQSIIKTTIHLHKTVKGKKVIEKVLVAERNVSYDYPLQEGDDIHTMVEGLYLYQTSTKVASVTHYCHDGYMQRVVETTGYSILAREWPDHAVEHIKQGLIRRGWTVTGEL